MDSIFIRIQYMTSWPRQLRRQSAESHHFGGPWVRIQARTENMSKFFFCEDFFNFFFIKSAKGVSINYVDTFKTASSPSLDLCPHAWNKLAYSVLDVQQIFTPSKRCLVGSYFSATRRLVEQKIWATMYSFPLYKNEH